jgi:hypothetical protein
VSGFEGARAGTVGAFYRSNAAVQKTLEFNGNHPGKRAFRRFDRLLLVHHRIMINRMMMEETRWGAVSPGSGWLISTIRADFVSFTSKFVRISPNLLPLPLYCWPLDTKLSGQQYNGHFSFSKTFCVRRSQRSSVLSPSAPAQRSERQSHQRDLRVVQRVREGSQLRSVPQVLA